MGFSRQEYWSGLPFPSPGDLPYPGIELASLTFSASASRFFTTSTTWEAQSSRQDLNSIAGFRVQGAHHFPSCPPILKSGTVNSCWPEFGLQGRVPLRGVLIRKREPRQEGLTHTTSSSSPGFLRLKEGNPRSGQPLPDDAPLRLDPNDGGILHVLEEQVLVDLGPVHLHRHLHFQHLV